MTYVQERPVGTHEAAQTTVTPPIASPGVSHSAEGPDSDRNPSDPPYPPEDPTIRRSIRQSLTFTHDAASSDAATSNAAIPDTTTHETGTGGQLNLMVLEVAIAPDSASGQSSLQSSFQSCHLTLQVPFEMYQVIIQEQWFNLIPAILRTDHDGKFDPSMDVVMEIGLKPNLLEQLAESLALAELLALEGTNPDSVARQLSDLNETAPEIFQADHWLCCSVQQIHNDIPVGYTTLWAHLLDHPLTHRGQNSAPVDDDMVDAFTTLFKNAATTFKSELEQQLPQLQSNWTEFLDDLKTMMEEMVNDLESREDATHDSWLDKDNGNTNPEQPILNQPFLETVVKPFFDREEWSFAQLDDNTLQLAFQGENGRWMCLAESSDVTQQFIFYSLYPFPVEMEHREQIASILEFLMRANSGMIMGNFELDFDSGDVRFKTSIDIEGINHQSAIDPSLTQRSLVRRQVLAQLLRQLVYINVITMDRYFPGMTALVNQTMTAPEAIALCEQ